MKVLRVLVLGIVLAAAPAPLPFSASLAGQQTALADMQAFAAFYEVRMRAENWEPDERTSRDERVAFLQRTVKLFCNPNLAMKRASDTRPISDEALVSVRSGEYRQFWDFIRSGGSANYQILKSSGDLGHGEILDASQPLVNPLTLGKLGEPTKVVPVVAGCVPPSQPQPTPVPVPAPTPVYPPYPPTEAVVDQAGSALFADFAEAGQQPNDQMFRFAFRVAYSWLTKEVPSLDASVAKHRQEWRQLLGLPPLGQK